MTPEPFLDSPHAPGMRRRLDALLPSDAESRKTARLVLGGSAFMVLWTMVLIGYVVFTVFVQHSEVNGVVYVVLAAPLVITHLVVKLWPSRRGH